MIIRALKYPLRIVRQQFIHWQNRQYVTARLSDHGIKKTSFNFPAFRERTIKFLDGLQTDDSKIRYRYSAACTLPTLYASAYACMTYSLLNALDRFDAQTKADWITYFDSYQQAETGLFVDPTVQNEYFDDSDWWGARHLVLHMISAYTDLGAKPKYPFRFLETYYDLEFLQRWLMENSSKFSGAMDHDFDNKLMNIVCALQYQRDIWKDDRAGKAVSFIQKELLKKINPATGLWGDADMRNEDARSRTVQFAYHLFPFYFYDNIFTFDFDKILPHVLKTQNNFGGYGVAVNSSACEDIDSVDILNRLPGMSSDQQIKIETSLDEGFTWITANQMEDGGFVFRLNEKFVYGHPQMTGEKNQGAVFPTWFRTLSLAYLNQHFDLGGDFKITRCPGYEF
jgi:hypothetical protein